MVSPLSGPTPPDDAGRVQPIKPITPVGDVLSKPKDPMQLPKKKRAILRGSEVELLPDDGEPVLVPLSEFVARYRALFGVDPAPGELLDRQA